MDKIDDYLEKRNKSFVIDETDELKIIMNNLLGDFKKGMSNEEIKQLSSKYLSSIENYVDKMENYLSNQKTAEIQNKLVSL